MFLLCQETAFETGTWPPDIQLSHGSAGVVQLKAESVAELLNFQKEYQDAVINKNGPIAEAAKRVSKTTQKLLNGRAACVCGRIDKGGNSLLRRKCWKGKYDCLPVLEAKRISEEKKFWASLSGKQCCGAMLTCPLKKHGS